MYPKVPLLNHEECKETEIFEENTRSTSVEDDVFMESDNSSILQEFPEGSFEILFWMNKLNVASKKDKWRIGRDLPMVKWYLYLRHKSSKAYEILRDSGCVSLPSQHTLHDYTDYVNATAGGISI